MQQSCALRGIGLKFLLLANSWLWTKELHRVESSAVSLISESRPQFFLIGDARKDFETRQISSSCHFKVKSLVKALSSSSMASAKAVRIVLPHPGLWAHSVSVNQGAVRMRWSTPGPTQGLHLDFRSYLHNPSQHRKCELHFFQSTFIHLLSFSNELNPLPTA